MGPSNIITTNEIKYFERKPHCGSPILLELEFWVLVFVEGGKLENPEKNPQSNARTNKRNPHMAPGRNQTMASLRRGEDSDHCAIPTTLLPKINFRKESKWLLKNGEVVLIITKIIIQKYSTQGIWTCWKSHLYYITNTKLVTGVATWAVTWISMFFLWSNLHEALSIDNSMFRTISFLLFLSNTPSYVKRYRGVRNY